MSPEYLFEWYKQIRELVKQQPGYIPCEKDWERVPYSARKLMSIAPRGLITSRDISLIVTETLRIAIIFVDHNNHRPNISNGLFSGFLSYEARLLIEEGESSSAQNIEELSKEVSAVSRPKGVLPTDLTFTYPLSL